VRGKSKNKERRDGTKERERDGELERQ